MQICHACQRHVKAAPCPFCGSPRTLATPPAPREPATSADAAPPLDAGGNAAEPEAPGAFSARTAVEIYGSPPAPSAGPEGSRR